ncbi:MAG: hypothetical protein EBV03_10775 [Proteobacteria bacterium]|nr:hypothetical protein [Pseudomonadota bacterium]
MTDKPKPTHAIKTSGGKQLVALWAHQGGKLKNVAFQDRHWTGDQKGTLTLTPREAGKAQYGISFSTTRDGATVHIDFGFIARPGATDANGNPMPSRFGPEKPGLGIDARRQTVELVPVA